MECGVAVDRAIAGNEAMGGTGIGVWIGGTAGAGVAVGAGVATCCWKVDVGY